MPSSENTFLTWDLFLAPSIPAITSDVPPGETERPWPVMPSTTAIICISQSRQISRSAKSGLLPSIKWSR